MTQLEGEPTEPTLVAVHELAAINLISETTEAFIKATEIGSTGVTDSTMSGLVGAKRDALLAMLPFHQNQFYAKTGNEQLIDAAIGSIMNATEQLWDTASKLDPSDPTNMAFDDSLREGVLRVLSSPESSQGEVLVAMGALINVHKHALDRSFDKFMTLEPVIDYHLQQMDIEERRKRLEIAAVTTAAAFVGSLAAYKWASRKAKEKP